MKEVIVNGEVYVRKKDVNIFVLEEKKGEWCDYGIVKEIILEFIKENQENTVIKNNVANLFYEDFKEYLIKKNIKQTIFLKVLANLGLILRNTQKKYKHQTSVNGNRTTILKIDFSKIKGLKDDES